MLSLIETEQLSHFESQLGYSFINKRNLVLALTHASFSYESKDIELENNEKLEFLGDGILDFVIADELYKRSSGKNEGYLSKTRSLIVCETTLTEKAKELGVGDLLLLGRGEVSTNGREKPSNLANAMEALFAAVYIDGGFEAARRVILSVLSSPVEAALSGKIIFDYKSRLIEHFQGMTKDKSIDFNIESESGPVHDKVFTATVVRDGNVIGKGIGRSKKQAEQEAAKAAMKSLENY
jgi:ribonuclease-3